MKTIDNYINEKLTLNKQTVIQPKNKININIDKTANFTNDEINIIIDFFNNYDIKPYDISNSLYVDDNPRYENTIFVHFKTIFSKNDNDNLNDAYIYFEKHYKNNNISVGVNWPTVSGKFKEESYLSYVPLNEIIQNRLPKLLKHEEFINSLEK